MYSTGTSTIYIVRGNCGSVKAALNFLRVRPRRVGKCPGRAAQEQPPPTQPPPPCPCPGAAPRFTGRVRGGGECWARVEGEGWGGGWAGGGVAVGRAVGGEGRGVRVCSRKDYALLLW